MYLNPQRHILCMLVVRLQKYFSTCGSQFLSEILQGMIDDPSREWQEDELPDITSQSHVCVSVFMSNVAAL